MRAGAAPTLVGAKATVSTREQKGLASGVLEVAPAASGEFAWSDAYHDAILGQAVLHCGDDLIRKRNLRIGRRLMKIGPGN